MLSGAVAGLIGMGPLLADPQYYKYGDQFPLTLGFTGLALALLGRNHPVGIAAAAIVWATIERATQRLSTDRHPAGDRPHPAGLVPARRRSSPSRSSTAGRSDAGDPRRRGEQPPHGRWERRREPRGRRAPAPRVASTEPVATASVVRGSRTSLVAARRRSGCAVMSLARVIADADRPDVVGHDRASACGWRSRSPSPASPACSPSAAAR